MAWLWPQASQATRNYLGTDPEVSPHLRDFRTRGQSKSFPINCSRVIPCAPATSLRIALSVPTRTGSWFGTVR